MLDAIGVSSGCERCASLCERVFACFVTHSIVTFMTVTEARRDYREYMSRMDVAFAFGHGCSISGWQRSPRAAANANERHRAAGTPASLAVDRTVSYTESGKPRQRAVELREAGRGQIVALPRGWPAARHVTSA
jgi:hypothetical protein